jgi:hypothetical protein
MGAAAGYDRTAYHSDIHVADAALANGLVQLLCPRLATVAALRWTTAGHLHNLPVELDEPPRWPLQQQQQQPPPPPSRQQQIALPEQPHQQNEHQQQQPQQQQQQQQQVEGFLSFVPAQLLSRSGLLAACAQLSPEALRQRLSELAVFAAPSYDGTSWGTGLLNWFWAAHEVLLVELNSYVWTRRGNASVSAGDMLRRAVMTRVRLAELLWETLR